MKRTNIILWTTQRLAVAFAIGVTAGGAGASESEPAQIDEVIVVFKTHFDIGYTALAREVLQNYRTSMIDRALAVCDQTRALPQEQQFVWTVPGWPMHQILWPGQEPDRRRRIEAAIGEGRLVWHALPGSLHTESLDPEDLVRGLGFSSHLSRRFGQPVARDAKMTDVPCHVWLLPTLLKHAGVEFLHLGCNSGSGSPELPRLFWWEGPDGSRVLTMYEASGYGSGLTPPPDWPHRTWLGLIHTGDNVGPPRPEDIDKLLQQATADLPGTRVRMGRLSDFADAILREGPELPVVRADMPDTWIHGIMSMPQETALARNIRPMIGAVESLDTLLRCWGEYDLPPATEVIAKAYEESLMYGEHTWGLSPVRVWGRDAGARPHGEAWKAGLAAGTYARLEESWREQGDYIRRAADLVLPALEHRLHALARAVDHAGLRVVVFNSLPWTRDDVVVLQRAPCLGAESVPARLRDAVTGEVVAVEQFDGGHRFLAKSLPPLGYRTYVPAPAARAFAQPAADVGPPVLENRWFRLELDPRRGVVTSLVHNASGRQWIDADSKYGFGQYLYERFDAAHSEAYLEAYGKIRPLPLWFRRGFSKIGLPDDVPYTAKSPEDFTLEVSRSAVSVTATMRAEGGVSGADGISLAVTLFAERPIIDLTWTITGKQPEAWPEAGWLCLPFAVRSPSYRLGRLGAVVDPAKDFVRGSNFDVFCLSGGMTVSDADGHGVGLCPIDAPLVSLGYPGIYRYAKEFTPREPVVLINLFNNAWGTNFQQWIGGSWQSRVRLWATGERGLEAAFVTPSSEARSPARAILVDGPAGALPLSRSGIELSRKGVLVTAFGPNPDGPGLILRLWEQAGQDGVCDVRLPEGINATEAQPVDLRGQPQGAPIPIRDGRLALPLRGYAPASVRLTVPVFDGHSKRAENASGGQ